MANLSNSLQTAMAISGAVAVAVVDMESGTTLGQGGGGNVLNLDASAASNTEIMRAKIRAIQALNLNDEIEDILITLDTQYHILRPIKTSEGTGLFLHIALDKTKTNLAMARHRLSAIGKEFTL